MRDGAGSRTAALRAGVDGEPRLPVGAGLAGADIEGGIGGQRHQPVAAADLDEIGGGPGAGMLVERLPAGDGKRVRAHGLDADLEAAGLDGLLDVLGDAGLQFRGELVLLGDGEREQAVEEARHRRQLLLEAALVDELEAGGVLEAVERPALDVVAPECQRRSIKYTTGRRKNAPLDAIQPSVGGCPGSP